MTHLQRAAEYVAKGDEYYGKAAAEIVEERKQNDTSWADIAAGVGKSKTWCQEIVTWHTSGRRAATPYSGEEYADRKAVDHTKRVLREASAAEIREIVSSLPRETVGHLEHAARSSWQELGLIRKTESERAFRANVGDELADGLETEQRLRDAEAKVFEARRALRDMLAILNDSDLSAMRDSWREDFLKTLDDLAMRIDVARSVLGGTLTADLERFLAEV